VLRRHDRHKIIGIERHRHDLGGEHDRKAYQRGIVRAADMCKRQIEQPAAHQGQQLLGVILDEAQLDTGMLKVELPDQRGQLPFNHSRQCADRQLPAQQPSKFTHLATDSLHVEQDALGALDKRQARCGEPHAPAAAFEELHAKILFQLADLLRKRRLRNV
jgi:hypothetical protein